MNRITRLAALVFVFAAVFFLSSGAARLHANFTTHHNRVTREHISKGVVYEHHRRVTDMGLLDVFILRVPATDPNIVISPASSREPGLKETAQSLLESAGAIAGVNGDFFGLAGHHSMPSGLQVDVNRVVSASSNNNLGARRYSSFMLADDGNYFMDFVNVAVGFYNNGVANVRIASMNKTADLAGASVITADFMADTMYIDARIPDAVKIVVDRGMIVHISAKGETVVVPPTGYIVLLSGSYADQILYRFAVGQIAELTVNANLNIWALQSAISGGGRILLDGELITDGQQIVLGVHPRTAIGMSRDGREIILMVVDGRSHSVGVTHTQLAQLMLEAGAWNAMHLDGGGSSTMHITRAGANQMSIVNHPSGGFERRIINALGVFVNAPLGHLHSLAIDIPDVIVRNAPNRFIVYGLDEYMRRIDIPQDHIHISMTGNGSIHGLGGSIIAYDQGLYTITANFGGFVGHKTVYSTELFEIRPNRSEIITYVGGTFPLNFTGVGANGNVFALPHGSVSIEVFPPALGSVMDGMFIAQSLGTGWLRFGVGATNAFIPLYVTIRSILIDNLAGDRPISASSVPDGTWAQAFYTPIPGYFMPVATLIYHFREAEHTQAAYAHFQGIVSDAAAGFRLAVYGDLSGMWLRGRVIDAYGTHHLIDFARVIDWEGWQDLEVWLPRNMAYPITLESIYVASLREDRDISGQIRFSNLRGLYDHTADYPEVITPPSDRFRDHLFAEFYEFSDWGYDITFMPSAAAPAAFRYFENRAYDIFLYNSSAGIYMGNFTYNFHNDRQHTIARNHTHLVQYSPGFSIYGLGDLYVIEITARGSEDNNGMMFADITQWARIQNAIDMSWTFNVVIISDISPRNFANRAEYELLHSLLRDFARRNYNIFVLSGDGAAPEINVIDGVRYISLGPLFTDGEMNEDFGVLRFRIWDDSVRYTIERIM